MPMPTKSALKQIKINTEPWGQQPTITPILKKESKLKNSVPNSKNKDIKLKLTEAKERRDIYLNFI